jgi:hypothetical protein
MYGWNVYYNVFGRCVTTIQATSKADAEAWAFEKFSRPMMIDLNREEYKSNALVEHL